MKLWQRLRESCPGNAKREGGISEKSDWGKAAPSLRSQRFQQKEKGQERAVLKKEGFAQISYDREEPKPSTGCSMGSSKIQLSGELKPNSVTHEAGRS